MEQFCLGADIAVDEWIDEIGSGMNFKRKKFLDLMARIGRGEIQRLIIAHKDRLSRFGFDSFEHYATTNGCEILVAKTLVASKRASLSTKSISLTGDD